MYNGVPAAKLLDGEYTVVESVVKVQASLDVANPTVVPPPPLVLYSNI